MYFPFLRTKYAFPHFLHPLPTAHAISPVPVSSCGIRATRTLDQVSYGD